MAHFDLASEAEVAGIPPTMPPVLTEEALDSLHEAWILTPYLSSDFPTLEEGEYNAIKVAITDIREGTRDLCRGDGAPPPDSHRSQSILAPSGTAARSDPTESDRPGPPAGRDRTRPVDRQPASSVPTEGTLLERTLEILKGSSKAKSMVKFLHGETGHKTTLREVTRRYYSEGREPTADRQETAKQQIRRTAKTLAERRAPLRMEYDWDRDEIELVEVAAKPDPATPSGKDVADVVE
jgi:hypothetical protein